MVPESPVMVSKNHGHRRGLLGAVVLEALWVLGRHPSTALHCWWCAAVCFSDGAWRPVDATRARVVLGSLVAAGPAHF